MLSVRQVLFCLSVSLPWNLPNIWTAWNWRAHTMKTLLDNSDWRTRVKRSLSAFARPPARFWFVNRTSAKGLTGQLPKEWKEGCRVKFQQTNRWKAWQGGPSGPYSKVPDQQLLWDCPSKRVRSGSASKTLYLWNSLHYKQSFHIQNQRIIHKLRNSTGDHNPSTKFVCLF